VAAKKLRNAKIEVRHSDFSDGTHWRVKVEIRREDGYVLRVTLAPVGERIVVRDLALVPRSAKLIPAGGLTKDRHLDQITWDEIVAAAVEIGKRFVADSPTAAEELRVLLAGKFQQAGGRPQLPLEHWAALAIEVDRLMHDGVRGKALAQALGYASPRNLRPKLAAKGLMEIDPYDEKHWRATDEAYRLVGRVRP
jgi:hypothetical protein